MLKGAWLLPAIIFVALLFAALLPVAPHAAETGDFQRQPQVRFKDLPGVVPEAERVEKNGYDCTSDIEEIYRPRGNFDILYGDTAPTRVYRCKSESGVTYTGTQVPNTHWVPGLNPRHLPK